MKIDPARLSWVDLVVIGLLIIGVLRGRKRGMSEELLDLLKWLLIVVVAAQFYQAIGDLIAVNSMFSRLSWYLGIYVAIILAIKIIFSLIKKRIGEKLVGSDIFGRAEYYLGMSAGAVRYACVIIVIMAVTFLEHFITWQQPAETLMFGAALALVVASLVLFQFYSERSKGERHRPETMHRARRELFQQGQERLDVEHAVDDSDGAVTEPSEPESQPDSGRSGSA